MFSHIDQKEFLDKHLEGSKKIPEYEFIIDPANLSDVTVVTEKDWKSILAQADRTPDREDLVWIRDDNRDVVAVIINDPELIEIYNAARKDAKK